MLDIRVNEKYYRTLKKAYEKRFGKTHSVISFKLDDTVTDAVIMTQTKKGKFVEWMRGYDNVLNFLIHGYNRIVSKCPYTILGLFQCKAEKCQLYYIKNMTGDCSHRWNVVLQGDRVTE